MTDDCFPQGTVFIHKGDDVALLVAGRHQRNQPHVAADDILLHLVEGADLSGIFQSGDGVSAQMPVSFLLVFLPVIEEKVMQKPASGSAFAVPPQQFGNKKTKIRYVQTMVEPGMTVVLYVVAQLLHLGMFQQRANVEIKFSNHI